MAEHQVHFDAKVLFFKVAQLAEIEICIWPDDIIKMLLQSSKVVMDHPSFLFCCLNLANVSNMF